MFDAWFDRRPERDLVVKMNTGNGKTLVGLMLLKSSLNERVGPAAYLTPDPTYLVDQVEASAKDLGLSTSREPRDPAVASGSAILLATVKTLFNGRSKFGVVPEGRKIKLGTVLIDDAHACPATVEEQFEIRIPSDHPAYNRLLELFTPALRQQQPASLVELKDEDPYAVMMVPPWDWQDQQGSVLERLRPYRDDEYLGWGWPLIRGVLPICRCVFTAREVQIKPPCPPVGQIPSFIQAKRRLYLTATLADDSVLVTHFGADPACVSRPITPGAADDIGDRMILTPQEVRPDWSDQDIQNYVTELACTYNVVVIVPSVNRAALWRDVADDELYAYNLREGIERLKQKAAGLVVLVNKYDGVDLPDDACRVLVIDGLPEAYTGIDRIESSALDDTVAMTARQLQRIEQGMGRGIRSRDDYCVVMLIGGRLMSRLHDADAPTHFSTATATQLQLSRLVAEQLAEGGVEDLRAAVEQCLTRNPGWVRASRNALVGVKYGSGSVAPTAAYQRRAVDLAGQQRYTEAADAQQMAVNAAADPRERGWLKQQLAAYIHPVDPVRAQQQQASALDDNPGLLRPKQGIAYVRLKGRAGEQAEAAALFLRDQYPSGSDLLIGVNAILDDLVFDSDPSRVDPFEQAVADLGTHLGFVTQRPERDIKRGPDDLWAFGDQAYAVIECKSGAVTDFIRKRDLDQLSGALNWFRSQYELPASALPVMIHPSNTPHRTAAAPVGCRVITTSTLPKLRDAVRAWATALASDDQYRNPDAVRQQLLARKLNGRHAITDYARIPIVPT